jgi:hypothetical protein
LNTFIPLLVWVSHRENGGFVSQRLVIKRESAGEVILTVFEAFFIQSIVN